MLPLLSCRVAGRDEAYPCVVYVDGQVSMRYSQQTTVTGLPKSKPTFFRFTMGCVENGQRQRVEHDCSSLSKSYAMIHQIFLGFRVIPHNVK